MVAVGAKTKVASPDQACRLKGTARCRAAPVDTAAAARLQARNGVNLALVVSEMLAMVLEAIKDELALVPSYRDGMCFAGACICCLARSINNHDKVFVEKNAPACGQTKDLRVFDSSCTAPFHQHHLLVFCTPVFKVYP